MIAAMVWNFWCDKYVDKEYTYARHAQEEKDYKRYFDILTTHEATDHPYGHLTPMYTLRSK